MSSPFAAFIGIRRMICYVFCFLNFTCHLIREESYTSNIASFPALSSIHSKKSMHIIIVCLNAE